MRVRSMLGAVLAAAVAACAAPPAGCAEAKGGTHKTDWMHKGKWGVMIHFCNNVKNIKDPVRWNGILDNFDVKGLVGQLRELGVGWLMLDSRHCGYPLAPSLAYEKAHPGRPPKRDLILALADELAKHDLKLILYFNTNMKFAPKAANVELSVAMIEEYSGRYGAKVSGWWFDNNDARVPQETVRPIQKRIARAARSGNPDTLVAFSPWHGPRRNSPEDDYTAGNVHRMKGLSCPGRFVDGCQWHVLSYLGHTWGSWKPRWEDNRAVTYTRMFSDAGGAVTWDTPHELSGRISPRIFPQLKAIAKAVGTGE